MDSATIFSIVAVGVTSSLAHCFGMCGGFMVALGSFLNQENRLKNFAIIFSYNLARIFAYVLQGAFFGAFGGFFTLSLKARGYLFFAIGIFLAILAVALLQRGEILNFLESNSPFYKFVNSKMRTVMGANSKFGFLLLGFLNGFLPCGVVYYFLAISISSGSALNGVFVMAIFGAISLFMMSFYAVAIRILSDKFRNLMLYISAGLILIYGIYLAFLGFRATL